jgi:peptidylprolyl isomerase domain and WD repeat-containing protein 1
MLTLARPGLAALKHEKLYLDHLPKADRYSKSFMHRDTVTQVALTA